jgi:hypothetical protein
MSEPTTPDVDEELSDDSIRQHSQDPAEGPDPDADESDAVPREHTQDPAEG